MVEREIKVRIVIVMLVVFMVTIVPIAGHAEETNGTAAVTAETQKELLQNDNGWTIFRYVDSETNAPKFDVRYMGKKQEELKKENLGLRYRICKKFFDSVKNCYGFQSYYLNDIAEIMTEEIVVSEEVVARGSGSGINTVSACKEHYYIQFEVDNGHLIKSSSCAIPIWPQEPYIVSSNIDFGVNYKIESNPNVIDVNLIYNEHLTVVDENAFKTYVPIDEEYLSNPFLVEGLAIKNNTNTVTIDGNSYTTETCTISFKMTLPKYWYPRSQGEQIYSNAYAIDFEGVRGAVSNKEIDEFVLNVQTPTHEPGYVPVERIEIIAPGEAVIVGNVLLPRVLEVGKPVALTVKIVPENASDKTVTWSSGNGEYATVDENGVVTALPAGAGHYINIYVIEKNNRYGNAKGHMVKFKIAAYSKNGDEVVSDNRKYQCTITDIDKKTVEYKSQKGNNAKTVKIPDTVSINGETYKVTSIAKNAFKDNKKITNVTIGKNITSVEDNAFSGCEKLKTVVISKNVDKIGRGAFNNCKKLKNITIKSKNLSEKNIGKNAFKGIPKNATIKVPKKSLKAYKKFFYKKGISKKVKIKS